MHTLYIVAGHLISPSPDPLLATFANCTGLIIGEDRGENLSKLLTAFARIPYENLTKIISTHEHRSRVVKHTPEQVISGFITEGTGGTCFPLTLTLQRLVQALGYECFPILADRRYGVDTHCALICRCTPETWHLIDPGYLITAPCPVSHHGTTRHNLPLTTIELRPVPETRLVSLYTRIGSDPKAADLKYRLTYKVIPVDDETFHAAWDRSFDWEMMTYPIVSILKGNTQVYLQKSNLIIRSPNNSQRTPLSDAKIISELSRHTSISATVIQRALECLR